MGHNSSVPVSLPRADAMPELDEMRSRFIMSVRSPEASQMVSKIFQGTDATQTALFDQKQITELNWLGFVTTGSQPGLVVREQNPLDWPKYTQAMKMATQEADRGGPWRFSEIYKQLGGRNSQDRRVSESQRAYLEGFMLPDEAMELFDIVNRTDIVCIIPNQQCKCAVPVTYQYANWVPERSLIWPGYPYFTTSMGLATSTDSLPPHAQQFAKQLVFVQCFDPQHGRLASEYMYPTVILPIVRMIRSRHERTT